MSRYTPADPLRIHLIWLKLYITSTHHTNLNTLSSQLYAFAHPDLTIRLAARLERQFA